MNYPSHQSPNIVANYEPFIKQALEVYPNVLAVQPHTVAFATFIARLRDSIKALTLYEYETSLTEEQLGQLTSLVENREIQVSPCKGQVFIGSPEEIKKRKGSALSSTGRLVNISTTNLQTELDKPSVETIEALALLIQKGVVDSMSFTGCSLQAVQELLPDGLEAYQLGDKIVIG